jgi:hypothetical protein
LINKDVNMAQEMITVLPSVANAELTDIIYAVQGYLSPSVPGVSVQETLQQVLNTMQANIVLSNAGNPNGVLAGKVYQLCWDVTDNFLYVCTIQGSASGAVWTPCIGQLTNGQLAIGSTGNAPIRATLTAGTNISIVNTSGAITISSTGMAGFTWTHVTGVSQAMVSNNGYVADNAGLVTLTLPATSLFGDAIDIVGRGAGGWEIAQGAGQQVIIGNLSSTAGAGGSVSSTNRRDSLSLICTLANIEWTVLGAPQSLGLTIV